ncbi:MAG: 4-phosphoerythronate dehydrogenase [Muribaculaceae bacterium]|nr:4-phosphoerythronate dehydrogenase [Muribaculaceae bacterium]MDE7394038.1 4-phosphoerythronate dehydrogenase [Muribaculaceae bacterium]
MSSVEKKKVIIESHIPAVPVELAEHFNVVRLEPALITTEAVADADALIVRTRTRCNASLLAGSRVKFVATATIGTDHLDLPWLAANGIEAVSAPGCNAPAVAQYVFASLLHSGIALRGKTLAVIGVGHVGTIVARWGETLGINVLRVDPPRQRRGDPGHWLTLDEAASQADIITFHTPLTLSGSDATYHLASQQLIGRLKSGAILINAARGEIFDTEAVVNAVEAGTIAAPIVDCWENEPDISLRLLQSAAVATPHIAGYSLEGKLRATSTVIAALCRRFNAPLPHLPQINDPEGHGASAPTAEAIANSYNPLIDTAGLRHDPSLFEQLRNLYQLRNENI